MRTMMRDLGVHLKYAPFCFCHPTPIQTDIAIQLRLAVTLAGFQASWQTDLGRLRALIQDSAIAAQMGPRDLQGMTVLIQVLEVFTEHGDHPLAPRAYQEMLRDVFLAEVHPPGCHTLPDWEWLRRFAEVILPASTLIVPYQVRVGY